MKLCKRVLTALLATMFVLAAPAKAADNEVANKVTDESTQAPAIEPEALKIFKGMADYLASASVFAYHAESSYDVVQDSGIKVEFGASRKILVARPNRLRMEAQRRDGLRAVIVFDGKEIWAFEPDENVYATAAQPGDLDASIHFAVNELRIKAPLTDLLAADFYEKVTAQLTGALDLGETVVAGVTCDHLLMSNDYADFQMWITTGDKPMLKRIVITYREEPGEPQFRAQFLKWDMSPTDTKGKFEFKPPEGAERIRFYVPATDKGLHGEGKS